MKTTTQKREQQPQLRMPEMTEYIERDQSGAIVARETVTSNGINRAEVLRGQQPGAGRARPTATFASDMPPIQHRAAQYWSPATVAHSGLPAAHQRKALPPRPSTNPALVRGAAICTALSHRLDPSVPLTDPARQYRHMSVLEMGRAYLEAAGRSTAGMDRFQLSAELMQYRSGGSGATSDFVAILSAVATKRLRNAYDEHKPTYQLWALQAPNAPDFKDITVVQISAAPELLQRSEHGEFQYGQMMASGESYKLLTYGRIVSLTRQAMINDDLGAFSRALSAYGQSARRLENRMVYAQLTANAALSDGVPLFHASHGNLATGGGSALQAASLAAGRTAMRLQKGWQGELLNIMPKYLIVPSSLEQTAYQFTSDQYVAAKPGDTNEYGTRGRTPLVPIVETVLDSFSVAGWYLAAQTGLVDTVEYCFLGNSDGPVLTAREDFDVDATSFRCRHDFAAKAIDHRGLYCGVGL